MDLEPITVGPDAPVVFGRSSSCDVLLEDPNASLSRQHLEISNSKEGGWIASDLGSRNGTLLNSVKMLPKIPSPLNHGDQIRLGSWVFRVQTDDAKPAHDLGGATFIHTLNDSANRTQQVERVRAEPLSTLASHRLAVLLECADDIHRATTLQEAADVALYAMVESSGYSRAAYLVPQGETGQYETVSFQSKNPLEDVLVVNFSQSLLDSAVDGEVVRLSSLVAHADYGQSIAELDIHSALCVPVMVEDQPIGFVYLDARGSESAVSHDASAFGRAVARLLGLTVSNLRSKALEIEQHAMQYDLDAAAKAQRLLLPPESGRVGGVCYSMLMRPGRMVAGDLFGVVELDDGRVCTFLGDVSGKGAGAAILMATTQSYIHAMLDQGIELGALITKLNRHIADRSTGQFVTMWIGILSPGTNETGSVEVEFIDAGHGHWLVTQGGGCAQRPEYRGELVVGIAPDIEFHSEKFLLQRDQRLVLFSDGVVEQTSPDTDEEFGLSKAGDLLASSKSTKEDVAILLEQVIGFAQSDQLRDDTTIASIGIDEHGSSSSVHP